METESPKQKRQKLIDEYRKEITTLENIAKAIHSKGVVADKETGTIEVKMSAGQLRELAEVKQQIFNMKKRLLDWEEKISEPDEELD